MVIQLSNEVVMLYRISTLNFFTAVDQNFIEKLEILGGLCTG